MASFVCHIILSSVAPMFLPYFSTLLQKCTIFGKYLLNIKCVFLCSGQLPPESFLNLRRNQRDIVATIHSCQIFNEFEVFYFTENSRIPQFMWSRPVCTELFLADRQTEGRTEGETNMEELTVAIGNFAKAPKIRVNYRHISLVCILHIQ
jgi:hypothetical protein